MDRREVRERIVRRSLRAPLLKPFLVFGKVIPRPRFRGQDVSELGRRRFLGELQTPGGLPTGMLGVHARSPCSIVALLTHATQMRA